MSSIRKLTAGTAIAALLALPAFAAAQEPPTQPPSQPPTPQPPATQPPTQTPAQPATPAAQGNEQVARRHLTEARNTLSELTQLPAAAQLTGETRTQVSQLISNFNELITAQSEWRASYAKVNANLTALIGPDPTATDPATSGTTGAVGTSGNTATNVDPAIREKLVEFRRQLSEFEKAASGASAPAAATADPTAPPATPPTEPPTTPPTEPPTTPPSTPPTTPPGTPPATPPTTPPTTPPATTPPTDPQTTPPSAGVQGNAEILRHIAAIEALIKTEDDSGGLTLTKAQLEQLRNHLALLRQGINNK